MSGKQTGSVEDETACISDLRDISSFNSQVQMISDSLAACKRISNYRSARRDCSYVAEVRPESTPRSSVQSLLPAEKKSSKHLPRGKSKTAVLFYGKTSLSSLMKGPATRKEVPSQKNSWVNVWGSLRSWSLEGIPPSPVATSDVDLCTQEEFLESENLTDVDPGLALIVTRLFDILWHCKGCSKCNKKIRPSIPLILSRIQKLADHVAIKKRRSSFRAGNRDRLPEAEREEETSEDPHPRERRKEFETLEKIEAVAVSEDHPGIQILLQVKTLAPTKKFFVKPENLKVGTRSGADPALQPKESATATLAQILPPRPPFQSRRKLFTLEEVRFRFGALLCGELFQAVVRSLAATTRTALREPYEEARDQAQGPPLAVECGAEEMPATEAQGASEGGEMQIQRVKELEGEVRGLKDLMVEVHKNQVELNRVLVEKGLRSRGLSVLAASEMLEEESEILERTESLGSKDSFVEALQLKVNDLKRKSSVKNRMIVALLKGLRSDVPKEWWEDLIDYIFDDESDPEKVDEFIRQTSLFLLDGEKGSTVPSSTQNEGLSPEEEPKTRGAEVEDTLKNVFIFNEIDEKKSDTFVEDGPPLRIWAFPTTHVPDPVNLMLKRLENQISLLNEENKRLRHHVDELGEILKIWVNETNGKENIRPEPNQDTFQPIKPRKTINLTIRFQDKGVPGQRDAEEEVGESNQKLPTKFLPKFPSPRRPGNDLNCLDDSSPVLAEWARPLPKKKEKLRSLTSQEKGEAATPYPSAHEICRPRAASGPSARRHIGLGRLVEESSATGSAALSKERQLGTIPENEHPEWAPEGMSETIQRLRARVRSIHEDFSMLESKNDGIDKLLDGLMEDVVKKSERFEKNENGERGGLNESSVESLEGISGTAPRNLRFSSFIQNILCEDFRIGATIVDLFVALKAAKNNLNLLTESRSQALPRIKELTEGTGALREKVKALLEDMEDVLSRLDDEIQRWTSKGPKSCENEAKKVCERPEDVVKRGEETTNDWRDPGRKSGCPMRGGPEAEVDGRGSGSGNFLSVGSPCPKCGKKLWAGPTGGEELSAAVAGLLGNSEAPRWLTSVAVGFPQEQAEAKKSEDGVNLTDSAIQLICDICGILAGPQDSEVEESGDLVSSPDEIVASTKIDPSTNYFDAESGKLFCWNCDSKLLKEVREKWPVCRNYVGRKGEEARLKGCEDDAASETESVFEEALSDPYPVADPIAKPSVTCMGDLTKVVREKKSVSTLTATNDAPSFWVGQLTEDIKTKIKSLRSIKRVTVGEQSETSVASLSSGIELTIIAKTPAGVFDVNVKQYKDRKRKAEMATGSADLVPAATYSVGPVIFRDVESVPDDCFWSDDSLLLSGCGADNASNPVSDQNDFEEFLGLSMERQQEASGRIFCIPGKEGPMIAMFKAVEAPLFEVLKCEPRHFIQEILPKAAGPVPEGRLEEVDDVATLDSPDSNRKCVNSPEGRRYEDLSRLPHRLVIQNSSSDLIIYVQVEVDKAEVNLERAEVCVEVQEVKQVTDGGKMPGADGAAMQLEKMRKLEAEEWKKGNKKSSTFYDRLSDAMMEKEIREMLPEEPKIWATAAGYVSMKSMARVDICLRQNLSLEIYEIDQRKEERQQQEQRLRVPELDKALSLIHEIENDVMEVKLSDAILILPHLEWELHRHLRRKIKNLEKESDDHFVLADELLASPGGGVGDDSEERLQKLLSLVSGLEQALKLSECELHEQDSSRILCVLRTLTRSIREFEEETTLGSFAEALDIAPELNEAVREAEGAAAAAEELPGRERLRNVRRKVFEVVEQEAVATEGRVEGDFDRIACLARENDEVSMFVEVFLEKTHRRASELNAVKVELEKLLFDLKETRELSNGKEGTKDRSFLTRPSEGLTPSGGEKSLTNTVSSLLFALDNLKLRVRKKSDICRSILGLLPKEDKAEPPVEEPEVREPVEELSKISKSFLISKTTDLASFLKEFKQIGDNSLYLSWTKPEGHLAESVAGYEILVNGKRHQKVRNPERLQAVLYSVDLSDGTEVQLQAIIPNGPKTLLTTVTYRRER